MKRPIVIVLVMSSIASANTYYVDADSLGGDGRSPEKAWSELEQIKNLNPGDHVLLKRGCIWRDELIIGDSGTVQEPIYVGAYGQGEPPLIKQTDICGPWELYFEEGVKRVWRTDYTGSLPAGGLLEDGQRRTQHFVATDQLPENHLPDLCTSAWKGGFYYRKDVGEPAGCEIGARHTAITVRGSHIVLESLRCEGPGGSFSSRNLGACVLIEGDIVVVRDVLVSKSSGKGLANAGDYVYCQGVTATENMDTGIGTDGDHVAITGCRSYNNGALVHDTGDRNGISVNAGGGKTWIVGNEVFANARNDNDADFEISVFEPTAPIVICNNYIHDCYQGGIQIAVSGAGSFIGYNRFERWGTSTYTRSTYGKYAAIRLGTHVAGQTKAENVEIVGNQFLEAGVAANPTSSPGIVVWRDGMDGLRIRDNIFYDNDRRHITIGRDAETERIYIDRNLYYGGTWYWKGTTCESFEQWQQLSGQDRNSVAF